MMHILLRKGMAMASWALCHARVLLAVSALLAGAGTAVPADPASASAPATQSAENRLARLPDARILQLDLRPSEGIAGRLLVPPPGANGFADCVLVLSEATLTVHSKDRDRKVDVPQLQWRLAGCVGDVAVLWCGREVLGVDTAAGQIAWKWQGAGPTEKVDVPKALEGGLATAPAPATQLDLRVGKSTRYVAVFGDRVVAVQKADMTCLNAKTGREIWTKADEPAWGERLISLQAGGGMLMAHWESTGTFAQIKTYYLKNGSPLSTYAPNKVVFAQVSPAGIMHMGEPEHTSAHDLTDAAPKKPYLWQSRVLAASRLGAVTTAKGLIMLDGAGGVTHYDARDGTVLWQKTEVYEYEPAAGKDAALYCLGKSLVVVSQPGITSIDLRSGEINWFTRPPAEKRTRTVSTVATERHLVVLRSEVGNPGNPHMLDVIDIKNGRMNFRGPIKAGGTEPDPPALRAWQVIDNAIMLESGDKVYCLKVVPAGDAK